MGKFILETYPTIEDRVTRWKNLGMLDSVKTEESKKLVAMALESLSAGLLELNYKNIKKETKTALLPVFVRIFRETTESFTIDELVKSSMFIINDFSKKYEDNLENFNDFESVECLDEAKFIEKYCSDFSFNKID